MKRVVYASLVGLLAVSLGFSAQKQAKGSTFLGTISDKMCGAKHMMAGKSDKECTLECGAPFVLVTSNGKVYELSDKEKPKAFAGQKVKVTGNLKGEMLQVNSIEASE